MNPLIEEILIAIFLQCLGLDIPNISNFGKNEASFTYLTVTILAPYSPTRVHGERRILILTSLFPFFLQETSPEVS